MKTFRFPLDKALEWRRKQLEREESLLRIRSAALAEVDRARAELEAAALTAELEVRRAGSVTGAELSALDAFRLQARIEDRRLATVRDQRAREVETQQAAMLEARRRCRLLERLRERRWEEWKAAADREIEETAAESYLARWVSPRRQSYNEMHDP